MILRKLAELCIGLVIVFSLIIFSGNTVKASEPVLYGAENAVEDKELTLEDILRYSLESQYLKRSIDNGIFNSFGKVKPYQEMERYSGTGISELEILFLKRGYKIPEDKSSKYFKAATDFKTNLEYSYNNEIKNIIMYEMFLKQDLPDDVRVVLEALKLRGNQDLKAIEASLDEINGINMENTVDDNIVTRFFNWLGRSFDDMIH